MFKRLSLALAAALTTCTPAYALDVAGIPAICAPNIHALEDSYGEFTAVDMVDTSKDSPALVYMENNVWRFWGLLDESGFICVIWSTKLGVEG